MVKAPLGSTGNPDTMDSAHPTKRFGYQAQSSADIQWSWRVICWKLHLPSRTCECSDTEGAVGEPLVLFPLESLHACGPRPTSSGLRPDSLQDTNGHLNTDLRFTGMCGAIANKGISS